ncbi:hypothetical protein RHSIM_RhsimUnG0165100 [Rhododendron simsii]|uniref:Uncharacterized protein n=1 Tax=Rhododendron simsii TaxID=118357 RepID=A0A834L3Y0_RHOSS|nr:hypothetical protein RHSIM_RhsimUnG0165100 [Rhododendron simsii]
MIAVVILMAAVISTANAGCTLPQGTNGSHEVLIPGHQSSIPSDVLTTPPPVTADRAPLDVVDSGGQDDDSCVGGDYQATAAGIHRNDCIAEFPPHHVDVPAVTGEISSSTDQIRTEERVEDNDEKGSFKFGNKMALMVSSFQPRGNLSLLATWSRSWSPSWSTSSPPPTSSWSSSASFPVTVARLAVLFGFAARLIGRMMLRRGHRTAANFFRHAGYFSGLKYVTPLEARRHWLWHGSLVTWKLWEAVWDLGRWFLLVAGVGGGADFSGLRGGAGLGHKIPKVT